MIVCNCSLMDKGWNASSRGFSSQGSKEKRFGGFVVEGVYWRQKARVKWVKERDCSSKFSHRVANGKRNMKFIKYLDNEERATLDNLKNIYEEIVGLFGKLYASPLGDSWRLEDLDWSPILEESAN